MNLMQKELFNTEQPNIVNDVSNSKLICELYGLGAGNGYDVIYVDPPWQYTGSKPGHCVPSHKHKQPECISAEYYYETMPLRDIKNIDVKNIAAANSVLFLWVTTPIIPWGVELVDAWGFKYKTMITWEKTNKDCMGYWFRTCTEHLMLGVRGGVKAFRSMERSLYRSARGKHSEKPQYFYELIEKVTSGKRIELFARRARENWDVWGNQAPKAV